MVRPRCGRWCDRVLSSESDAGATPEALDRAPELQRTASYMSGVRFPGSYWLAGSAGARLPSLYVSSAFRVVRDVRADLRLSGDPRWDLELFSALRRALDGLRPPSVGDALWRTTLDQGASAARDGQVIPLEALRQALWFTYCQGDYPDGPSSLRFAASLGLPRVGQTMSGDVQAPSTQVVVDFDANRLAYNPFTAEAGPLDDPYNPWTQGGSVRTGEAIHVTGGKKPGGVLGGGAGVMVAVVALGALALADEDNR